MALVGLPPLDSSGAIVMISGERRAGKTTLLLSVREAAVRRGLRVGGFLSVARFSGAEKTGIDLMDAASGRVLPLADVGGSGPVRTGHFAFDPATLAAGVACAEAGQKADLFFVDEIGPLELVRGEGWAAVLPLIAARTFGAALVVVRPELLDAAREQLGLPPESPLVVVTPEQAEPLREALFAWVGERWAR